MDEKDTSRFDDREKAPTPSPLRASNTVESLKPRDISWPTATLPGPGYAGSPADVPPELDPFKTYDPVWKTDLFTEPEQSGKLNANVLPVNFPASTGLGGKKLDLPKETIFRPQPATLTGVQGELAKPVKVSMPRPMPAMEVRILRLEEQMDALLDRIAKYNTKSSHKI